MRKSLFAVFLFVLFCGFSLAQQTGDDQGPGKKKAQILKAVDSSECQFLIAADFLSTSQPKKTQPPGQR